MVPVQAWRAERRVALGTTRCSRPRCWELVSRGLGHVRARRPLPDDTTFRVGSSRVRWQLVGGRRASVAVEVSKSRSFEVSNQPTPRARRRAGVPARRDGRVFTTHSRRSTEYRQHPVALSVQRTLRVSSRQHSARREWPHPVNGRILRLPHAGHPDEEQTYLLRHAAAKPTPRL